ncbi:MAG: dockerin type I domain-containing protein [Candidatus Poribacteria bacterium]|nr:dockerin type I domain-containing protein [Candidatus Poribacteria bacterium]
MSVVLIVRSAIKHKNSYNTDVNGDGVTNEIDLLIVKAKAHEAIVAAAPTSIRKKKITTWGALKRR